ncbi:MAG: hypothetical protein NVS2B9_01290 [Myxococcales bacterium]
MRRWAIAATSALVLVLLGVVALAAVLLRGGMAARTEPSPLEARLALNLRALGLRASRARLNPVPASVETLAEARTHFADHCASCHGNDGSGQTQMGRNLYPRAPDMRLAATQRLTDGELFAIIEEGVRFTGMPAWGDQSAESQLATWKLVHFIRHLPRLSPEELVEMEALNPKAAGDRQEEQDEEDFLNGKDPAPAKGGHHH